MDAISIFFSLYLGYLIFNISEACDIRYLREW